MERTINLGVNPCARKGQAVSVSSKTPRRVSQNFLGI